MKRAFFVAAMTMASALAAPPDAARAQRSTARAAAALPDARTAAGG